MVFLGLPRSAAAEHAHECGWRMRLPMLLLAAACVAIGLAPVLFWPAVAAAATAWQPAWAGVAVPAPLATLGRVHLVVAALAVAAVWLLGRRVRQNGVRRQGTWDCGYAAPTPRMQYTAGSFAGIITGWFSWILQPRRHGRPIRGLFPQSAAREEHTPETVLERLVEPVSAGVMRVAVAVRRLQHGRLQAYFFYLLAGLVALACLALLGGAP